MQTIKNILKITPAGAILSDRFGSDSGIALEIMLGTAVQLVFDLRSDNTSENGELTVYPPESISANAYYLALDQNNNNSSSPLLLQCDHITLTADADGHTLFTVPIPDTAVKKLCQAMAERSTGQMLCEIGGFNSNGTAVFAWQFAVTVRNRVYSGGGTPSAAELPDYYTAPQVEAAIARELIFEFSSDGTSWHQECSADDEFLRLRHGQNGQPSNAMPLPPRFNDTPWLPEIADIPGTAVELALTANRYCIFTEHLTELTITAVPESLQETVLKFTASDTGIAVSFPVTLNWVSEPSFEAGKTYLVSIVNNIAVAAEVTV